MGGEKSVRDEGSTLIAHYFVVRVDAANREQAEQVMSERLDPDEDYGFDYLLDWNSMPEELVEVEAELADVAAIERDVKAAQRRGL